MSSSALLDTHRFEQSVIREYPYAILVAIRPQGLRQRFGSSPEKLKQSIDRLQPILGDLEEDEAEAGSSGPEPEAPARPRRKPKRKPLPESLPRDIVEHPTACACPKGGRWRQMV